jgi:hypothetical protein
MFSLGNTRLQAFTIIQLKDTGAQQVGLAGIVAVTLVMSTTRTNLNLLMAAVITILPTEERSIRVPATVLSRLPDEWGDRDLQCAV